MAPKNNSPKTKLHRTVSQALRNVELAEFKREFLKARAEMELKNTAKARLNFENAMKKALNTLNHRR